MKEPEKSRFYVVKAEEKRRIAGNSQTGSMNSGWCHGVVFTWYLRL
jgi:hypothetical protein